MSARTKILLGIDEAGRGPVIGPLVICGVWIPSARQRKLLEIGVQDSKVFGSTLRGQRRREQLAQQIRDLASRVTLLTIDAVEVDRRTRLGELNLLEQELASAIINTGAPPSRIIADGARLFGPLQRDYTQLRACDGADQHYPVVAAASIVAKVERDHQLHCIIEPYEKELGPIRGGGYPNQATADFLRRYVTRHGCLPDGVRQSWSWPVLRDLDRQLAGLPPLRRHQPEQLSLLAAEEDPP